MAYGEPRSVKADAPRLFSGQSESNLGKALELAPGLVTMSGVPVQTG